MSEFLINLLVLTIVLLPIFGIVDAARRPQSQWERLGQSKGLWIVLQLLLGIVGAAIYFAVIRRRLDTP